MSGFQVVLVVAAATSALFVGGFAAPAEADGHTTRQDGLVNVTVGDVEIANGVNVSVVANVCDAVDAGPIAAGVLGKAPATDNSGRDKTICMAGTERVTTTQNAIDG